jgi:uncharacterized caspase-like protein
VALLWPINEFVLRVDCQFRGEAMLGSICRLIATVILCAAATGAWAAQPKRVALVIGNSAYQFSSPLSNPTNDAADMAAALKRLGFEVVEGRDLDESGMRRTIKRFAEVLTGADVGLFFYAGHGLQVGGHNYLVPVDAKLESPAGLDFELIRLDVIHRTMERETKTNVIFLDACRDNPLSRNLARSMGTRSSQIGKGLAVVESGVGTLISFSTQPGNTALDGDGRNSPFAGSLIRHIGNPREDLSTLLIQVRNEVMAATKDQQIPWEHSALRSKFYFAALPPVEAANPTEPSYERRVELEFWMSVKDSSDAAVLGTYLGRYPNGEFAPIARALIEHYERQLKLQAASREEERKRQEEMRKEAEVKRLEDERRAREAALAEERKRAEAAKDSSQVKRVDEQQQAEVAARTEELRKALEEARTAREAAKAAEQQRLAALKAAEEARSRAKMASLSAATHELTAEASALARGLQTELRRVGCDPGDADGTWGPKARNALKEFASATKLSLTIETPTEAALQALKEKKGRICALTCGPGERESGGKCVARPPEQRRPQVADQPSRPETGSVGRDPCEGKSWVCRSIRSGR